MCHQWIFLFEYVSQRPNLNPEELHESSFFSPRSLYLSEPYIIEEYIFGCLALYQENIFN